MLTQSAIRGAYPLAALLQRNQKALDVQPQTALYDVLEACNALNVGSGVDGADVDLSSADKVSAAVMEASEAGQEDHDEAINAVRDQAYKAVTFTMDIARNKAVPQIKAVVESTQQYLEQQRTESTNPLKVEAQFLSPALVSPTLDDLVSPYKDAFVNEVEPVVIGAQWDEGDHFPCIQTGIGDFDNEVREHLVKNGCDVRDVWERFFSDVAGKYRDGNFQSAAKSVDQALVAFLGAHRLLEAEEVPEGLKVNLTTYRSYLARIREQAGARIAHLLKGMIDARKAKQLVLSAPKLTRPNEIVRGPIVVVGETYNEWLKEGGSPEVLYGAVLSNSPLNYKTLLDGCDEHVAVWKRVQSLLASRSASHTQASLIQGLYRALMELGQTIDDDQLVTSRNDLSGVIGIQLDRVHFNADSLDHLYSIARNLVCDIYYPHTDILHFLCEMDSVCQGNAELDIREAALLVAIQYVTDWIGQQIIVTNNA